MFFIIILLYNVVQVFSTRQTFPTNRIIREVNETQYSSLVNQSLLLQFTNYMGIFDLQLASQQQGQYIQIEKVDPSNSQINHECQPYDRHIQYKLLFNSNPLFDNETSDNLNSNITSLYASTHNIFVLRSDLKLFIFKPFYDLNRQEIVDLKQDSSLDLKTLLTNESTTQSPQESVLKCYQNQSVTIDCYAFTQLGTIHFSYNQVENQIQSQKQVSLELNSKVIDMHLDYQNRLLLIMNKQEVIVYQILSDGSLNQTQKLISDVKANLMQIKTNQIGSHIFILDKEIGILIYKFDKNIFEIKLSDQIIPIKGGRALDIQGKTMFILFETEDQLPYVMELFYDFEKEEYYLNRITLHEYEVNSVYVDETQTILLGYDLHILIENSIFRRFQENQNQYLFSQAGLFQISKLKQPWFEYSKSGFPFEKGLFKQIQFTYDETYLIGISQKEIHLFVFNSIPPWILCKAETTQINLYQLKMKSKICPTMKNQAEDPFIICDSSIDFSLQGFETYFYVDDSTLIISIMIVAIFILIALIRLLFICINKKAKIILQDEQGSIQMNAQDESRLKTEPFPV